jgi:hypothetical protein
MPNSCKWFRRKSRLRAVLPAVISLALVACDQGDVFNPDDSTTPQPGDQGPLPVDDQTGVQVAEMDIPISASLSFAGGIPIGMFSQPVTTFNGRYNGSKLTVSPSSIVKVLSGAKAVGGRMVLMLAGDPRDFKDGDGHFSLSMWKARVDRFKSVNFGSYISDGTIIAHYLLDEPNDPNNWNGQPVPASTLEEMARHSKQLWPSMATVVRVHPSYLRSDHRYLDAAWAQYLYRRGNVNDYIRKNVSDAQQRGLGLVVGLNFLDGGAPHGTPMSSSEVESWGSALLSSTYPCAFISYKYNSTFLSSPGVGSAMDALRSKAENRSSKSCLRG